jgi:hypothetical protein
MDAALRYADLGFRVFPCIVGGKEPACEHGCLDATTDEEQITRWWTANPLLNVAISTDGLFVVDVDPDGKNWITTVDAADLLRGPITATPRKGCHYWFRQNGVELKNTVSVIAPGVDTRANGGYVLAPPSVVDGKAYHWVSELESDLPEPPGWIIELLGHRTPLRESVGEQIIVGSRNQALIRFAGYLRRSGMGEQEILTSLEAINANRCRPPLPGREVASIAKSAARFDPDMVEEARLLNHFDDGSDDEIPEHDDPLAEFPEKCLDTMPGVMREAFDWMIQSAIKPQPELTLGALVALFGAAFGRKVCDDYDTRTNVMVLGLSPSGSGKEHPRQCNKKLLLVSGMGEVNGPERIGSHAGIISSLSSTKDPIRLFQLDEIGRLLATMRDPKVSHLYNVGTVLMALYSSANTLWTGDAYADTTKTKQINQPHVCVYGTSVPESLYSGLSPENLTDGLVGRLLIFQSTKVPPRRKPVKSGTPWRVVDTLKYWWNLRTPGGGNLNSPPIEAKKTEDADQRHEWYCDRVNGKHGTDDPIAAAVWARAPEKAAKLALIYAACESGNGSVEITLEAENWGIELANYSTRVVLQAARNSVSGSRYEHDLKFVFSCIEGDVTQNQLTRKTQRLKLKERMDILLDLERSGAIEVVKVDSGKRIKTIYRKRRRTL